MKAPNSVLPQGPASGEDIERYEVVNGVRVEREPMGAFETVLASWLCYVVNSFAAGNKLGLAVNEVLFVLNAARTLNRRPDVAFVSYARWPTSVVAREAAWNVVPDLAIEIVSPTNLAEEIDRKITDYFQSGMAAAISANTSGMGRVSRSSAPCPVAGYTRRRSFWPEKSGIWAMISSQVPPSSSSGVVIIFLPLVG
jgi:Putative restriction endonuclease